MRSYREGERVVPKFRDRMETRRFLRLLAEARRRYGGPSRYAAPIQERSPEAPWQPDDEPLAPPRPRAKEPQT